MRITTYKEIADKANLAKPSVGKSFGNILDEICRKKGLPWLNEIAISKGTHRPDMVESYYA